MTTENLGGGGGKATHLHRRSWNCGCKICPGCPRSYTSQRNAQATQAKHNIHSSQKKMPCILEKRNFVSRDHMRCTL
ncbi:hypothetical protein CPAR01_02566 [Colletotrichum paranaense]|uniref:C2H2-type domain-containing protein n=1 Tax=Colletotrichum paranaense TaxID=1914294 RepID=A0ABQ9T0L5_9PEZI|nr:uncharacterized protein CPAR01_02566 [Colletotrichum paranaense]KAK1545064.1 hypothetical protein CPAR01_02566 [Colletotrichum paranaense]